MTTRPVAGVGTWQVSGVRDRGHLHGVGESHAVSGVHPVELALAQLLRIELGMLNIFPLVHGSETSSRCPDGGVRESKEGGRVVLSRAARPKRHR